MRKLFNLVAVLGVSLALGSSLQAEPGKAGKADRHLAKTQLKIGGASCSASCAQLSEAIQKVSGVKKQEFCTKSHTATIQFDPATVSKRQIIAAIRKAGYTVEGEQVELKVDGMMCGACSGKVSSALGHVKGVLAKEVSLKDKTAKVVFDPEKVSEKQIIAAIDRTGFKVKQ